MAGLKRLEEVVGDKVSGYFYSSKKSNMKNKYILHNGDCLDVMRKIEDNSVDAIICDLPYGTTQCKWDTVIPFNELWTQYKRIIKDKGVIVLFGSEPFSSSLRMSNIKSYKYDWIWEKSRKTGHLNAKKMPMMSNENISVFYDKQPTYNPQGVKPCNAVKKNTDGRKKANVFGDTLKPEHIQKATNYPVRIIRFNNEHNVGKHPTQKPVALMEYLVKTYTNELDIVMDNTMGSGTTGVACMNLNRKFIGIELDENYYDTAVDRIRSAQDGSIETKESVGKRKECNRPNLFSEQM